MLAHGCARPAESPAPEADQAAEDATGDAPAPDAGAMGEEGNEAIDASPSTAKRSPAAATAAKSSSSKKRAKRTKPKGSSTVALVGREGAVSGGGDDVFLRCSCPARFGPAPLMLDHVHNCRPSERSWARWPTSRLRRSTRRTCSRARRSGAAAGASETRASRIRTREREAMTEGIQDLAMVASLLGGSTSGLAKDAGLQGGSTN